MDKEVKSPQPRLFYSSFCDLGDHVNPFKHRLLRDTTIIVFITLVILILSGIVGVAIVLLIRSSGYDYVVSSFGEFLHAPFHETWRRIKNRPISRTYKFYPSPAAFVSTNSHELIIDIIDKFLS